MCNVTQQIYLHVIQNISNLNSQTVPTNFMNKHKRKKYINHKILRKHKSVKALLKDTIKNVSWMKEICSYY